jgi:hypothetical protein
MERIIQYVKDRAKDFDDYIPRRRRKAIRGKLRCR